VPQAPDPASALTGLAAMWTEMEQAPRIVQPSDFWRSPNDRNTRRLDDEGSARFKRTVNQNYFSIRSSALLPRALRHARLSAHATKSA